MRSMLKRSIRQGLRYSSTWRPSFRPERPEVKSFKDDNKSIAFQKYDHQLGELYKKLRE